jgi:hypothetical protein
VKRPVQQATVDFCNEQGITYDPGVGMLAHSNGKPLTSWESGGAVWVNIYLDEYPAPVMAWALANGLPPEGHTVRQIDGDIWNIRLANLECVPDVVAASKSPRSATGYRNVSVINGMFRAKVKKAGRYHIRDFNQLQDAVAYVNDIKGVRKPFTGKAVVEGVTRVDTVRRGKPYTYWRACRMHDGGPMHSTFSTKEKAEAWRPTTKKSEPLTAEDIATFKRLLGFQSWQSSST